MIIQICVGSSCHLKGSEKIVELFQKAIEQYHLERDITLAGSFCTGKCNRVGVTVQVDDDIYPGVTVEGFNEFFEDKDPKYIFVVNDRNLSQIKHDIEHLGMQFDRVVM